MENLMLFALLPLGLASLWNRLPRSTAGFGFLAALAPVVAKGLGSLIGSKQKKAAAKQEEEARRLMAQREDELARQKWEAEQNSPAAQAARFKSTLALGRLAGAMGGMAKVPKSLASFYQSGRTMPQYTGTSSYIPTPKKGGGGWDLLGGITDALSYLDYDKLKGGGKNKGVLSGFGSGSSFGNESPTYKTGQLNQALNPAKVMDIPIKRYGMGG